MSDVSKSRWNMALLWTILVTMFTGIWKASEVHSDVKQIKAMIPMIQDHERRIIRIETKLGISHWKTNSNTVAEYRNPDL